MQTQNLTIDKFLGLVTGRDEVNVPLGGTISCAGMAVYPDNRVSRIPGLDDLGTVSGAEGAITVSWADTFSSVEKLMIGMYDNSGVGKIRNLTDSADVTGPALGSGEDSTLLSGIWSSTFYLGQRYVANGDDPIQVITGATTRVNMPATTPPPTARLIQTYLGRLFVVGLDSNIVSYSDSLDVEFPTNSKLNIDEVPGSVTAMFINSPTSSAQTIVAELVFAKRGGLVKLSGDPADPSSSKDAVSQSVGCISPMTPKNTDAGTLFLGIKGGRFSVYALRLGTAGEPVDIGQALYGILNDGNLQDVQLSTAVFHDGFYKLFLKRDGDIVEVWGDIRRFLEEQVIIWYGVHQRGVKQSPLVLENGELRVFEVIGGFGTHFREKTQRATGFVDAVGDTFTAELDIPLNVEPEFDNKSYDLLNLRIARESNVSGNAVTVTRYSEGVQIGTPVSFGLFVSAIDKGHNVKIPITGENGASLSGRFARVKVQQLTGVRLDIIKFEVQYLIPEDRKMKEP